MTGKLYLFPTTLGDSNLDRVLPAENTLLIKDIRHFIVENVRTARRFLAKSELREIIDESVFFELNNHTKPDELFDFLQPALQGQAMGLFSEAGCPGVADPGADIVKLAHEFGITVVPLVGPSSILLALMASGFNGQSFAFQGYLPVKSNERVKRIKQLENRSRTDNQTQIFIEAPYRNKQLLDDILVAAHPRTMLCVALDLTLETEKIISLPVELWTGINENIQKRPAIFLLQA